MWRVDHQVRGARNIHAGVFCLQLGSLIQPLGDYPTERSVHLNWSGNVTQLNLAVVCSQLEAAGDVGYARALGAGDGQIAADVRSSDVRITQRKVHVTLDARHVSKSVARFCGETALN